MRKTTLTLTSTLGGACLLLGAGAPSAFAAAPTGPLVDQSVAVLRSVGADPKLAGQLSRARGVLIIPRYGQGGLIVGARGGEGLILVRSREHWSDPAFYKVRSVTLGAQIGAQGGSVALLLMSQKAIDDVMGGNNFSIDANAGLSVAKASAQTQAAVAGAPDAILWSNVKGAYAGANIGVSDVAQDRATDRAFYHRDVAVSDILTGRVRTAGGSALAKTLDRVAGRHMAAAS